jgi:outer membrane protein
MKELANSSTHTLMSHSKKQCLLRSILNSRSFLKGVWALSFATFLAIPALGMAETESSIDPQLKELFTLALAHNPNIEMAKSDIDINGYQFDLSRSEGGPTVQLISELSYSWGKEKEFGRTANQLRASYPLYQPEIKARTDVSKQAVEVAKQAVKISQQDILLEIAMQYYEYWQQQAEWDFLGKERQTYLGLLEQSKSRFQLGYQDLNDLTEIQAKIDNIRARQIAVQQKMENVYFKLTELVNSSFDMSGFTRRNTLPKRFTHLPSKNISKNDQAWTDLISHNPAIMEADNQINLIGKQVKVEKLSDGPQVELFTSYIYNDSNGHYYDDMQGLKGGVQIRIPIYLSGRTEAKISKTKASKQQIETKKDILINKIIRVAQQAQVSYDLGIQQLSLLQKAIESNKQAIQAIESGMSTGNRNMMDLLKAYSDLHTAEKTIPILKAKLWQYWWQLQWVTGHLAQAQ